MALALGEVAILAMLLQVHRDLKKLREEAQRPRRTGPPSKD